MGNLPSFALEEKRTEVRERSTPHDLRHIREKVGRLPGENFIRGMKYPCSRPTGIVLSDADCGAVRTGFESRRRHGCL
ncbi:hypothetical protein TNCV_2268151 [Trichonephila clavipes]|nr:hypothetical protein TNCV_2268151 [Trichonephila clavipes]